MPLPRPETEKLSNMIQNKLTVNGDPRSPFQTYFRRHTADLVLSLAGWYWVDPNLGVPTDAIQVWCNVTTKAETCIYPKSRMVSQVCHRQNRFRCWCDF